MNSLQRHLRSAPPPTVTDGPGSAAPPEILRRLVGARPRSRTGEACELCATPLVDDHRHVVDVRTQTLRCSCRGCALLFSAGGRYLAVPDRYLRVEPFRLTPGQWTALQIPVGMAFFMHSSPSGGTTVAFYPSPAGATESELGLDAWRPIVDANPPLTNVAPDVEAILIRVAHAATSRPGRTAPTRGPAPPPECYIVPIDCCYELVGELRLHWHGFDGGSLVREHIEAFFTDVRTRSRVTGGSHG